MFPEPYRVDDGAISASFQKIPDTYGFSGAVTVTELLRQIGYRTGHFGKWHIGPTTTPGTYGIDVVKELANDRKGPRGRDAAIVDEAIQFIRANKNAAFYVNVWFHTVHNPVDPPQAYLDKFKNLKVNPNDFKNPEMASRLLASKKSGENIDLGMRKYMGDMLQLDDQVARLLKVIGDLGLAENTIVVFSSDNGPQGYGSAGPFRGGKHTLHDGGVHQPLIVRWPGHVPAGRVDTKSVLASVDWLPTLCSITGAKFDRSKIVGEDESDIWLGEERNRKQDLFWKTWGDKAAPAMLRGSWKLHFQRRGPPELYDLSKDPGERTNVADRHPEVLRELSAALNRWNATLPKTHIGSEDKKD